jgi:hypothetical protein
MRKKKSKNKSQPKINANRKANNQNKKREVGREKCLGKQYSQR